MSFYLAGEIRSYELNCHFLFLCSGTEIKDGERLPVAVKDMGACEIYPQTVAHNPNGRFVVVCGDGEYIIYTSMALRNKAFGSAQEFVWALESSEYAIRESSGTVKCFRNFKERKSFTPDYGAEGKFSLLFCSSFNRSIDVNIEAHHGDWHINFWIRLP